MTYKQIETSREIRQWLKLIVPSIAGAVLITDGLFPDLKHQVAEKIKSKFKKEKEK